MSKMDSLVDSVKAWFNQLHEVNLRIQEREDGLYQAERRLIRFLPQQSRILDIGCAAGRVSIVLAREGHTVTGIDVAEELIEQAQTLAAKQKLEITYQVCDPMILPFPDSIFDAVLLLKTYCYVPKRQNRKAWLNEIARVLKPEGRLCLSQYVIDEVLGSYEPIFEENLSRFPDISSKLEAGDGFSLPVESSDTVAFVHYFMEADLRDELVSSSFQIVDPFREEAIFYCTLKKHML